MVELLIGMDVSGDNEHTNYKFLGIVVGQHQSIMSLSQNIGKYSEHMANIHRGREDVIEKLVFDSTSRTAFCVKLDRKRIVEEIMNSRHVRRKKLQKGKVLRTYNYVVIQEIKKRLETIAIKDGISVTELVIQCDVDCQPFAKAGALKHTLKGVAYRISDYVAWCNNRNCTPPSVIEIDFTTDITTRMKKILHLE